MARWTDLRHLILLLSSLLISEGAKWDLKNEHVFISYGGKAVLSCTIDGRFEGFFDSQNVQINAAGRFKINQDVKTKMVLLINPVKEVDYGKYICRDNTSSAEITLEIEATIPAIESPQLVAVGFEGVINGAVYAAPKVPITWLKIENGKDVILATLQINGNVDDPTGRYNVTKKAMIIRNVTASDSGQYKVSAPKEGGSREALVTIDAGNRPSLTSTTPVFMMQTELLNLTIPCVWADAEGEVMWSFTSSTTNATTDITEGVVAEGLLLQAVTPDAEGDYTCTAGNKYGTSSKTVNLKNVIIKPIITEATFTNVSVLEGTSFSFICSSKGSPLPATTIKRLTDGTLLKSHFGTANHTIVLSESDSGDYLCQAQNGAQTAQGETIVVEKVMNINVLTLPSIIESKTTKSVTSAVGLDINITCAATGNPLPDITFNFITQVSFQTEKALNKEGYPVLMARTKNATEHDFGNVKCVAENDHGQVESTIVFNEVVRAPPPANVTMQGTYIGLEYIDIKWKPVTTADTYRVYVNDTLNRHLETPDKYYSVTHLNRSTCYSLQVASVNIAGVGERSQPIVLKTSAIIKPGKAVNFQVEGVTTVSATVKWAPPSNIESKSKDIITYVVQVCQVKNGTVVFPEKCLHIGEKKDTSLELRELKKGATYEVEVVAYNQRVRGEVATFTVKTKDMSPTSVPISSNKPLGSVAIACIIIAVILFILMVVDLCCCFFNNCGFTHCCYETFCAGKTNKYLPPAEQNVEAHDLKPKLEETV